MPLLEQMEEILRLLEAAKDDLESWVEVAEEEQLGIDTYETKDIISEIRSTLHDVGF